MCVGGKCGVKVWNYLTHSDQFTPGLMQATRNIKYTNVNFSVGLMVPSTSFASKVTVSGRYFTFLFHIIILYYIIILVLLLKLLFLEGILHFYFILYFYFIILYYNFSVGLMLPSTFVFKVTVSSSSPLAFLYIFYY
jgi:hypothetical protein